jgi:Holliday junction DNA helicase RuvB
LQQTEPEIKNEVIEIETEVKLRPQFLSEYTGQEQLKDGLGVVMNAAKQRGESLEHVLFYGPPGLGKTTLAGIVAKEMNSNLRTTSGPAIERAGDLASILINLFSGDVLFIDEIHRLQKVVEEMLYPAMEDGFLDIMVGKGPGARSIRMDLPPFTLIGATTQIGKISSPLRDRFGSVFHLEYYTPEELSYILQRSSGILGYELEEEAGFELARRSRLTPRIANRLLKRVRDFAQVSGHDTISLKTVVSALKMLGVDEFGLDNADRKLLTVMHEKFGGGPVGVSTLAAATGEDEHTISEVYEPFLLRMGLLKRTPKGREITPNGKKAIGVTN